MTFPSLPRPVAPSPEVGFSFAAALPSIGVAQRASLGRGLSFVLVVAVSCLVLVYAPLALHGPEGLPAGAVHPLPRNAPWAGPRFAAPAFIRTTR